MKKILYFFLALSATAYAANLDELENIKAIKYILEVPNETSIASDAFQQNALATLKKSNIRQRFMEQLILRAGRMNKSLNVLYNDSMIMIKSHFIEDDKDVVVKIEIKMNSDYNPIKVSTWIDVDDAPNVEVEKFTPKPAELESRTSRP